MHADLSTAHEGGNVGAVLGGHEGIMWRAVWKVEKYHGDWSGADIDAGLAPAPYEVIEEAGNLLVNGGISCIWQSLIGNGTTTAGQTLTYFNNGNAHIGVGDSTTAEAATQTNLQASTNLLRRPMDATYPLHTDGTTSGAATITFRSTFGSSEANFAWQEWGVFNASSGGRMLNRRVASNGTKASGSTWTFTVTLTLS